MSDEDIDAIEARSRDGLTADDARRVIDALRHARRVVRVLADGRDALEAQRDDFGRRAVVAERDLADALAALAARRWAGETLAACPSEEETTRMLAPQPATAATALELAAREADAAALLFSGSHEAVSCARHIAARIRAIPHLAKGGPL